MAQVIRITGNRTKRSENSQKMPIREVEARIEYCWDRADKKRYAASAVVVLCTALLWLGVFGLLALSTAPVHYKLAGFSLLFLVIPVWFAAWFDSRAEGSGC